jgi:FkbM family methyltransferase
MEGSRIGPWYGQYEEDRLVCEHVRLPDKGVFVDVGAGKPSELSNTYYFERHRNWSGLCIDADPRMIHWLRRLRRCAIEWAAVTKQEGNVSIYMAKNPTHTTLGSHLSWEQIQEVDRVPAFRLETLLEKRGIGKIDLLSIDVEGHELEAWRSMDWGMHQPTCVIIEHQTLTCPSAKPAILDAFRRLPYVLFAETLGNLLFCLEGSLCFDACPSGLP